MPCIYIVFTKYAMPVYEGIQRSFLTIKGLSDSHRCDGSESVCKINDFLLLYDYYKKI